MPKQIHVGDVGTVLTATVYDENGKVLPIGTATVLEFSFLRPDGTVVTKTGVRVGDGSTGQITYTTVADDTVFDSSGRWTMQAYVESPAGKWHTDQVSIEVAGNLA